MMPLTIKPKPKRRIPAYKLIPVAPRVLKNDIRRQYGRMYANVLNSFDPDLLTSFLSTFTSPSPKMKNEVEPLNDGTGNVCANPHNSTRIMPINTWEHEEMEALMMQSQHEREAFLESLPLHRAECSMEIEGKDMIIGFLLATRQITPDSVFRIEQTHIKTHSDRGSCELVCHVTISGMMLYDLPIEKVIEKVVVVCQRASANEKDSTKNTDRSTKGSNKKTRRNQEKGEEMEMEDEEHDDTEETRLIATRKGKLGPSSSATTNMLKAEFDPCKIYTDHRGIYPAALPKPARLELSGELTLFIDEFKRIDKIQFVQTNPSTTTTSSK